MDTTGDSTVKSELFRTESLFLLTVAISIIPFTSWGPTPWLMGVFSVLVSVVFFLEVTRTFSTRCFVVSRSPLWVSFLILFFLSLYHLTRSPVPYISFLFLAQLTVSLVFFHLLFSWLDKGSTKTIVLIWVGILVPWVLAEGFIFGVRAPGGPFLNQNYLATIILSSMAFLAGWMVDGRTGNTKGIIPAIAVFFCAVCLLLIGSRSAAIGTVLIFIVAAFRGKGWIRWFAVAMVLLVLLLPSTLRNRVTQEYKTDPHAFSRIQIWEETLKMGADHPLVGVGPNLFSWYSPVYAFPMEELPVRYGRIARKPHNEYLRVWAEGGVIGVIAAVFFLFLTLRQMGRAWRKGRTGPALAMGVVLFQAMFHDVTETFALMVLAMWWLALLTAQEREKTCLDGGKSIMTAVIFGLCLGGSTIFLNMDVTSRFFWEKGKELRLSDPEASGKHFARSLQLNPILPGAARDLAYIKLMVARRTGVAKDYEKAQESIARSWRLDRLDTRPLRLQAALFEDLAKRRSSGAEAAYLAAAGLLKEARGLEPHNVFIITSQADVLWKLGRKNEAMELIEQALDEEPNYFEAHRQKIGYLSDLDPNKVEAAESALEEARERANGYRPLSSYEELVLGEPVRGN